ncbi:MAG: class I tRNA ligase family protein, partial [Candidatus Dependentiae bacterium]|nr:class I tRNA ligase family protein [Candidatus Dependentiae bacterium]
MSAAEQVKEKLDFKHTLNLPKTDFPLRAETKKNDPRISARWESEGLPSAAQRCNDGKEKFILHDGPPYANGHIHLGHAYNKILKDVIAKSRRMMGYHVPYVPGWDCHGLPIEQKVSQEQPDIKGAELMRACRAYAARWVDTQRSEFKQLGLLMDWEHPYVTMDLAYEAATLRSFAQLVRSGFVERKNKTIPWCPTCQTALASAEIEYEDRTDPSIYVRFEVEQGWAKRLLPQLTGSISFVVWTTTPWTLPLNRAVLIKEGAEYAVLNAGGRYLIVGAPLVEKIVPLLAKAGIDSVSVVAQLSAAACAGVQLHHPLNPDRLVPVIIDPSVALDEGTACVHCAPGCGPSDYEVAVKNGLEIYSPLTSNGRYARGIEPVELEGMPVADGQLWVLRQLEMEGRLLFAGKITHSYPHCWRCHKGLIFRATPQWFCLLDHNGAKERALDAIEKIAFYPAQGRNFLRATVESRWEWCLSRQRAWGTPIPALLGESGSVFIDADFIEKVAERVALEGV